MTQDMPCPKSSFDGLSHRFAGAEKQSPLQLHDQNRAPGMFKELTLRRGSGFSRVDSIAAIASPHDRTAHVENEQYDRNRQTYENRQNDVEGDRQHRNDDHNQEIECRADAERCRSVPDPAKEPQTPEIEMLYGNYHDHRRKRHSRNVTEPPE